MGFIKNGKKKDFLANIKLLEAKLSTDKKPDLRPEDLQKGEIQNQSIKDRTGEAKLQRYNQDTNHRSSLVVWAATIVSFWLIAVLFILTRNTEQYKLSNTIMVTLLTTTTVNVLGLMIIVLNDLFRGKSKTKKTSK